MLVLQPIAHETIWGGARIFALTGFGGSSTGHLYSVYCREGTSNRILNGTLAGKTLNDVFPSFREEAGMADYEYFPLTIALTEADMNLSIQVHPNDEAASELEGIPRGKRESWYFLEPPSEGYIINGCTCRTEDEKAAMLAEKNYLGMADVLPVKKGDYVFVEPGTLHSITAGSLVYEIEEGADATYRFYDYERVGKDGRKRELHTEKAAASLNIRLKSTVRHYSGTSWLKEKTYSTRKIEQADSYVNTSGGVECFTMVEGRALCDGVILSSGMTVLLWPGESVDNAEIGLAFSAGLRRDVE